MARRNGPCLACSTAGGDAATELPELTGDDLATILFTSGSTGQSKGAFSDHRGVVQGTFSYVAQTLMALNIVTRQGKPPEGQPATLLNVPLFHVTAEVPVLLQSFVIGRKLVLMPKWDAEEAMRLIEREKISYFVGVPLMSYRDRPIPTATNTTSPAASPSPQAARRVRSSTSSASRKRWTGRSRSSAMA